MTEIVFVRFVHTKWLLRPHLLAFPYYLTPARFEPKWFEKRVSSVTIKLQPRVAIFVMIFFKKTTQVEVLSFVLLVVCGRGPKTQELLELFLLLYFSFDLCIINSNHHATPLTTYLPTSTYLCQPTYLYLSLYNRRRPRSRYQKLLEMFIFRRSFCFTEHNIECSCPFMAFLCIFSLRLH